MSAWRHPPNCRSRTAGQGVKPAERGCMSSLNTNRGGKRCCGCVIKRGLRQDSLHEKVLLPIIVELLPIWKMISGDARRER